jgi:hypothetical protein
MAEIVNLRLVRKKKVRADKEVRAAQNRIDFGRTKVERGKTKAEIDRASTHLDEHKRDAGGEQDD